MQGTTPATSNFLFEFLKLIRVLNLVMVGVAQILTRVFLIGPVENWQSILAETPLWLMVLSTMAITASGYIINDYYDVKIDVINKPDRVVIDRTLNRRNAFIIQWGLNIISLAIGYLLGLSILGLYVIAIFFLWFYSNQLKRLPFIGNFVVAVLTSLSILILAVYYQQNILFVYAFAIFAFFISVIREVVKDMEDIKGDRSHGCLTLPIVWGLRKTKSFLYIVILLFAATLFALTFFLMPLLLPGVYFVVFPVLAVLVGLLVRADTKKHYDFLSAYCKIIMAIGLVGIIFVPLL